MDNKNIVIRKAERQDVPLLLEFIRGIARYEKMENEVIASADVLEREMFDEHRAEAVFGVVDGREVGFALYFYNFSTFIGHSGLYLEFLPTKNRESPLFTGISRFYLPWVPGRTRTVDIQNHNLTL